MLPDNFRVIMLSRKREDTIAKHSLPLFPYATVTVDEREIDNYADVIPEKQLLPHPPFDSMPKIRNWLLDTIDVEFQIHVHDDLIRLWNIVGWRARKYSDPFVVAQLLERTAICARDADCFLFGVGNIRGSAPHYPKHRPFRLNGYVCNVIGFRQGHGLVWDEACKGHYDVDVGLQALLHHRIIWRDERWLFEDARLASNKGGFAGIRTESWLQEGRAAMLDKWGKGRYVRFRPRQAGNSDHPTTEATVIDVPRRDSAVGRGST